MNAQSEHLHQAAQWWLRLREPNVSPDIIAEWMRWCDASLENRDAFARVQSLWQKARLAPLKPVSERELRGQIPRRRWLPWAIAAVIAAGGLVAAPWLREQARMRMDNGASIATRVGANREVILPDGSHVVLGGATAMRADYNTSRRIVLLNSGEAFFKVHPDHNRPFIVQTAAGDVTAIGTAFNIRTDDRALRVAVSDGVVEVTTATQPVRLRVGQQITFAAASGAAVVSIVDPHVVTAWTTGTLKFNNEPLDSVVAAVNRYSATRIELRGHALEQLRYTGTVVSGRIDEWLAALPNAFPIEIVSPDSDRIIIRSRE